MTTAIEQFDFSVDLLRALLWQYNDAEHLQSLLNQKSAWYAENQQKFWEDWTRDVFNLQTATEFGLSVWAIILEIPLSFGVPGTGTRPVFGFGQYNLNFENSNFGRDSEGVITLTIEQRRLVLKLRYYQLVSDGTVPSINHMLKNVIGSGYVLDSLDMTASYVFPIQLPSAVLLVLEQFDILPRPAGVGIEILINPEDSFGFAPYYLNFENGAFGA